MLNQIASWNLIGIICIGILVGDFWNAIALVGHFSFFFSAFILEDTIVTVEDINDYYYTFTHCTITHGVDKNGKMKGALPIYTELGTHS